MCIRHGHRWHLPDARRALFVQHASASRTMTQSITHRDVRDGLVCGVLAAPAGMQNALIAVGPW